MSGEASIVSWGVIVHRGGKRDSILDCTTDNENSNDNGDRLDIQDDDEWWVIHQNVDVLIKQSIELPNTQIQQ